MSSKLIITFPNPHQEYKMAPQITIPLHTTRIRNVSSSLFLISYVVKSSQPSSCLLKRIVVKLRWDWEVVPLRFVKDCLICVFRHVLSIFIPELQNDAFVINFVAGCSGFRSIFRGIKESARMSHWNFWSHFSNCQYQAGNKFSRSSFFLHQTEEMSSMTGYFPEQAIIGFIPSKVAFEIRFIW